MGYKINSNQPIKYDLLVHTALPAYPTLPDFIVDVCSYLIKVHGSKKAELVSTDLKFSVKTLKYVFGNNMDNEEFRIKIKENLQNGIALEAFTKDGEFIFVSEETFTNYFSIV
jgi:hypothetical protein